MKDHYSSKSKVYYRELFEAMSQIVRGLKPPRRRENQLDPLFKQDAGKAQRILPHQEKRFVA